ncbi:MAG: hypothetical protein ACPHN2_12810 [Sinimarinibacterium flocculans]|uniref:hypothetical protein n=1 Tax=Sinimarinibacterium flocculans TaxID=985250 RepID=UPI003C319714
MGLLMHMEQGQGMGTRSSGRALRVWAGLLVLGIALPAHAVERVFSGEFAAGFDDNVANARRGAVLRDDVVAQVGAAYENVWRLAPNSLMGFQLSAEARGHDRYDGLDDIAASVRWRWAYRRDGGFYTPLLGASLRVERSEFDSRLRDVWTYRAGVFAQQQLTTRMTWRLGWSARAVDGVHARVFETGARSASVDLDWLLARRLVLYAGYQYLDGDLVSVAPNPPPAAVAAARAIAEDDVFDGESAFRLASRADVYSAGLNFSLSAHWSIDARWRLVDAEADTGTPYRREQGLLSLLWRY